MIAYIMTIQNISVILNIIRNYLVTFAFKICSNSTRSCENIAKRFCSFSDNRIY